MKPVTVKESNKDKRQRQVLFQLVDYFIKTGKPVGSSTLKEAGFPDLSSATIRNYFASLEEEGYLKQQHASGGRLPTDRAYRIYAEEVLGQSEPQWPKDHFEAETETREIAQYLQDAAERLSRITETAVFLAAPRFDNDFVVAIRLVRLSPQRVVCLLVTEFGDIQTLVLHSEPRLSAHAVKRIEDFCQARLSGIESSEPLPPEEEKIAQAFYNEAMLRYIVRYSHFVDEEIYRTGFSKLLMYPEFRDPHLLAHSLALFENAHSMRLMLRECSSKNQVRFWIGEDLLPYSQQPPYCAVLASPYCVNVTPVGAVGCLGPMRLPYRELFGILRGFSQEISQSLTRSLHKFRIRYRQPQSHALALPPDDAKRLLLMDKKKEQERRHDA